MAHPTMLVHLKLGQLNTSLLRIVRETAARFDAHVIGIAASQPFAMMPGDGYASGNSIESGTEEIADEMRTAEAEFGRAFSTSKNSTEWRSTVLGGPIADVVAREARSADLIITGTTAREGFDAQRHVNRGDLLMLAGRPLVIVPESSSTPILDNILIAWKDTRGAQRAVLDALPLLRRATCVTIVELTTESRIAGTRDGLGDVVRWLKRHDIDAAPMAVTSLGDDSRQINDIAREQATDTIVAGAYGHSRLREWILGGVTRELLSPLNCCSFLSH